MFDLPLQLWGGMGYLLNKICFSRSERSHNALQRRMWRIRSWWVYLAGLPAWIVVFVSKSNWIAAGVESGGAPSMVMGLVIAWRGRGREPKWLDYLSIVFVLTGLMISAYEFGGIKTIYQFLELGIAAGFLMGTYMMAKDKIQGYLWLMLGNVSCATLMGMEGFLILMTQQLISLLFVTDAYIVRKKAIIKQVYG